jgi:hypothetical protein
MPIILPAFIRKLIYPIVTYIGNKKSYSNHKNTSPIMSIYDIPFNDIDGNPTSLKQFEGKKILMYCPKCQTPFANSEIQMDNSYHHLYHYHCRCQYINIILYHRYHPYHFISPPCLPSPLPLVIDPCLSPLLSTVPASVL